MQLIQESIATAEVLSILSEFFGISGKVEPLNGEIDYNFKITTETEKYILKISRTDFDKDFLDFQVGILNYLSLKGTTECWPNIQPSLNGEQVVYITDKNQQTKAVRLLDWIEGSLFSKHKTKSPTLLYSFGQQLGITTKALAGFTHPYMNRIMEWDIAQGLWTKAHTQEFHEEVKECIAYFQNLFESQLSHYNTLPRSVIHNDANDNNVLTNMIDYEPHVVNIIDFGDALYTTTVNDIAIAITYGIMDTPNPLQAACTILKGYYEKFPISERELEILYVAVGMRLVISLTKSLINKTKEPHNTYLQISEKPALRLIADWKNIDPQCALYSFRESCGFTPCINHLQFKRYAQSTTWQLTDLVKNINLQKLQQLDLSVDSDVLGNYSDYLQSESYCRTIEQKLTEQNCMAIGGYAEARPIYTTEAYKVPVIEGFEHRTIHMGIDVWCKAGEPVSVPETGTIVSLHHNNQHKDYGGTIIVKHQAAEFIFYTLYGHLSSDSLKLHSIGDSVARGTIIGYTGVYDENGNWSPHLHFQIMLDLLGHTTDFPGVATPSQWKVFESVCPNPNMMFKLPILESIPRKKVDKIIETRKQILGKSLSISYKQPLHIVRGQSQYLLDSNGQQYLDTVNNVAHVGHEHPSVTNAAIRQLKKLNTNTRYIHESIIEFAELLRETLPKELSVLHFVNSGSEANELAMRMAKAYTGQKDMIALEIGYHGNTQACIDISSYKFDGKGGKGKPENTHIVPLPDSFRGRYRGQNTGKKYAWHVQEVIENLSISGKKPAAFIAESIVSCGGQIMLPPDYLKEAYKYARAGGAICIADEVQVGFGRVGHCFWGFQLHDVIPDIVTMGKPIGNGHPLAAVACTEDVALAFANGMEYFNTFGGNPVSCAIGKEVLRVIQNENLQQNALEVGNYLKMELTKLSQKHSILKDVRGEGLFLGIEFTDDKLQPLTAATSFIANKMKAYNILMSVDGPDNNVLKIKPPLTFNKSNAGYVVACLDKILEDLKP